MYPHGVDVDTCIHWWVDINRGIHQGVDVDRSIHQGLSEIEVVVIVLILCHRCSRFETEIRRLRILKPVRVCQTCHSQLKVKSDKPSRGKGNKTS